MVWWVPLGEDASRGSRDLFDVVFNGRLLEMKAQVQYILCLRAIGWSK